MDGSEMGSENTRSEIAKIDLVWALANPTSLKVGEKWGTPHHFLIRLLLALHRRCRSHHSFRCSAARRIRIDRSKRDHRQI